MRKFITAGLAAIALTLGAGAASAQPFHGPIYGPAVHREAFRHVPPHRVWVRGERFVPAYGRYVVVNDWRVYHLRRPGHGFHWVRAGGAFLLVGDRNGIIADVRFTAF